MGMREEFEAWVVQEAESREYGYMDWLLIRDMTGAGYSTTWVDMAWMGWQASRAALVIELKRYDQSYGCDEWYQTKNGAMMDSVEVIDVLTAAGVTVK